MYRTALVLDTEEEELKVGLELSWGRTGDSREVRKGIENILSSPLKVQPKGIPTLGVAQSSACPAPCPHPGGKRPSLSHGHILPDPSSPEF